MVKQIPTAVFPGKNAEPQTTTPLVDTQRRITPEWRRWTEFVDVTIRRFAGLFTFLKLEDTPDSYSGQSLKSVRVNAGETGLEFFTLTGTGDFSGPASAVTDDFVQFADTTGKLGKDGGLSRSTDGTFAANSDVKIPSQKSVKTYVDAGDAATLVSAKAYTDAVAQGLSIRDSCRLATAAALPTNVYSNGASGVGATLTAISTGTLTIDGVTAALGNRILVKNEVAGANNGIYTVTTAGAIGVLYVLTRATDYDQAADIFEGTFSFIEEGTANAASGYVLTTSGAVTVGTTALTFTQFSAAGSLSAASTTDVLTGTNTTKYATPDAIAALWEKGADVASASTTTLGEGGFFHITGTTTITAFAFSTDKAGRPAWLKFDGALTLTHNATSLILPTAANITTAAGDCATVVSEGSGNFRIVTYTRADGTALALANSGVTAATYGSSILIPVVTVDATGRVTSVTTAAVTGGGGGGAAQHQYECFGSLAAAASFTGVNTSVTSLTDGTVGMIAKWTSTGPNTLEIWKKAAPSTPYNIYMRFQPLLLGVNDQVGMCVRNSSNGKVVTWGANYSSPAVVSSQNWTNATTFSSSVYSSGNVPLWFPPWLRIENDGTNLKFYVSWDGNLWAQQTTATLASFIGTADEIGIFIVPQHATSAWIGNFGTTTPV